MVLVGPPNAGKSRLFNALLGQDRAIVSSHAGTTRDYLSALCDCDGLIVELIDTAGLDAAVDARSRARRKPSAPHRPAAPTSCSTAGRLTRRSLRRSPPIVPGSSSGPSPTPRPARSRDPAGHERRTGAGLASLRSAIASALRSQAADGDPIASTGARCRESLFRASEVLQSACETLLLDGSDELVAIDLRQAVDELGKVVGAVVTDDILDRIFRRFCIGK